MNVESRIVSLRTKHAVLDEQIRHEQAQHAPDTVRLTRLKTEKLYLKEEIERLSKH